MIYRHFNEIPFEGVSHNPEIRKKVLIRHGELPGLTGFSQAVFSCGQKADAHSHDNMYELFFVECGTGVIQVDGADYPVSAGAVIVVAPGEEHEIRNTGDRPLVITYLGIPASGSQI